MQTGKNTGAQFPGYGCMDDLTTECCFVLQATWVIDVLGLILDMLSKCVCTTRHWQTTGRLVQALNVCTVVPVPLLRGSFKCWPMFLDILPMDVCTTRHWQTTSRLVQELSVCTVVPVPLLRWPAIHQQASAEPSYFEVELVSLVSLFSNHGRVFHLSSSVEEWGNNKAIVPSSTATFIFLQSSTKVLGNLRQCVEN